MEKIDKLQFPLPYAQIVKLLMFVYVFGLVPLVSAPSPRRKEPNRRNQKREGPVAWCS